MTAHVVGFTGVDDAGQEGIELAHQAHARRQARQPARDQGPPRPHRRGRRVDPRRRRTARDLALAIDGKIQSLAFGALKSAVERAPRQGGRARSCSTCAPARCSRSPTCPSYNPNNRAELTGAQLRNRVITDLFEPGSTLKPFTVALALETRQGDARHDASQTAPGR